MLMETCTFLHQCTVPYSKGCTTTREGSYRWYSCAGGTLLPTASPGCCPALRSGHTLKHVALCKAEQLKPSPTAEGVSCLLVVISCFMEKVNAHFLAERFCFNKAETGIPALLSEYRREVYVKTTSFLLKNLHNGKWKLSFLFTKLF